MSVYDKQYYLTNREKILSYQRERQKLITPEFRRNKNLKSKYGITQEDYDKLLEKQNGVCAICKKLETSIHWKTGEVGYLHVDHDHNCCPEKKSCGKCIRKLLCSQCNNGLGQFKDNPNLLLEAANYLKETRCQ